MTTFKIQYLTKLVNYWLNQDMCKNGSGYFFIFLFFLKRRNHHDRAGWFSSWNLQGEFTLEYNRFPAWSVWEIQETVIQEKSLPNIFLKHYIFFLSLLFFSIFKINVFNKIKFFFICNFIFIKKGFLKLDCFCYLRSWIIV